MRRSAWASNPEPEERIRTRSPPSPLPKVPSDRTRVWVLYRPLPSMA